MISIENSLLVDKTAREVYDLFSQIDKLAWAFPTVTRVEVLDERRVNIGVMLKLGVLPLDNNLGLEVTERVEPRRLVAAGIAVPGGGLARAAKLADKEGATRISMVLDLEDVGVQRSRVKYTITADATGNLKRIYDAIIKGHRRRLESEFILNVAKILEVPVVEEQRTPPAHATDTDG